MGHQGYPAGLLFSRSSGLDGAHYSTPKQGWETTSVTRPVMINHLAQAIRERSLIVHHRDTQSEFLTFVIKPTGKAEAQEGHHDDRVFSLGIALEMLNQAPPDSIKVEDTAIETRPTSYRPKHYAPTSRFASARLN